MSALILIGHGSSKNPATRAPVDRAVKAIRQTGIFDEVQAGFLKEQPGVDTALSRCASEAITIVPFFISGGYYVDEVIPEKLGLDGALTERDGRRIRYTPPVGEHPLFAELIVQRAMEAGARGRETLAVLGHGTERNPNSAANVYLQAERVRAMERFPEVITVFIDQAPWMREVFEMSTGKDIVMVPLFVADGWHVSETIPDDLGIQEGALQREGKRLRYAAAAGTDPGVVDVILELAGS